eukprot:TRINITY_DN127_c1_g5_i2.p1 TRINITY_DN127_c1_g5~~TRINITY_DN127_c1_g5_i2.p1  ORF type:complete len:2708 (-),score=956.45 TRINITY_DN127_c1_g5_i2:38-7501(-)
MDPLTKMYAESGYAMCSKAKIPAPTPEQVGGGGAAIPNLTGDNLKQFQQKMCVAVANLKDKCISFNLNKCKSNMMIALKQCKAESVDALKLRLGLKDTLGDTIRAYVSSVTADLLPRVINAVPVKITFDDLKAFKAGNFKVETVGEIAWSDESPMRLLSGSAQFTKVTKPGAKAKSMVKGNLVIDVYGMKLTLNFASNENGDLSNMDGTLEIGKKKIKVSAVRGEGGFKIDTTASNIPLVPLVTAITGQTFPGPGFNLTNFNFKLDMATGVFSVAGRVDTSITWNYGALPLTLQRATVSINGVRTKATDKKPASIEVGDLKLFASGVRTRLAEEGAQSQEDKFSLWYQSSKSATKGIRVWTLRGNLDYYGIPFQLAIDRTIVASKDPKAPSQTRYMIVGSVDTSKGPVALGAVMDRAKLGDIPALARVGEVAKGSSIKVGKFSLDSLTGTLSFDVGVILGQPAQHKATIVDVDVQELGVRFSRSRTDPKAKFTISAEAYVQGSIKSVRAAAVVRKATGKAPKNARKLPTLDLRYAEIRYTVNQDPKKKVDPTVQFLLRGNKPVAGEKIAGTDIPTMQTVDQLAQLGLQAAQAPPAADGSGSGAAASDDATEVLLSIPRHSRHHQAHPASLAPMESDDVLIAARAAETVAQWKGVQISKFALYIRTTVTRLGDSNAATATNQVKTGTDVVVRLAMEGSMKINDAVDVTSAALVIGFSRSRWNTKWSVVGVASGIVMEKQVNLQMKLDTKAGSYSLAATGEVQDGLTLIQAGKHARLSASKLSIVVKGETVSKKNAKISLSASLAVSCTKNNWKKDGEIVFNWGTNDGSSATSLTFVNKGGKDPILIDMQQILQKITPFPIKKPIAGVISIVPPQQLAINRVSTPTGASWVVKSSAALVGFTNWPEIMQKFFPKKAQKCLFGFNNNQVFMDVVELMSRAGIKVDFEMGEKGTISAGIDKMRLSVGSMPSLSATLTAKIPTTLNKMFGVKADGSYAWNLFSGEDFAIEVGLKLKGWKPAVYGNIVGSPFTGFPVVTGPDGNARIDLKSVFGNFKLMLPQFTFDATGTFALRTSMQRDGPLYIPLKGIKKLLANAGLDKWAENFPERIKIDSIYLYKDGKVDFTPLFKMLGIKPEVQEKMKVFDKIARRLEANFPPRFLQYLNMEIPEAFTFDMNLNSVRRKFLISTNKFDGSRGTPIRMLLPTPLGLTGIVLHEFAFGDLMAGLLYAETDLEVDFFGFPALAVSAFKKPNPKWSDYLQKRGTTFYLQKVSWIIIYETVIPIPIPVFFDRMGVERYGLEGIEVGTNFGFPMPKITAEGAMNLANILTKYTSDPKARLAGTPNPKGVTCEFTSGPHFFALPKYLGGNVIGSRTKKKTWTAWEKLTPLVDFIKFFDVEKFVEGIPRKGRMVAGKYALFSAFEFDGSLGLTTLRELKAGVGAESALPAWNPDSLKKGLAPALKDVYAQVEGVDTIQGPKQAVLYGHGGLKVPNVYNLGTGFLGWVGPNGGGVKFFIKGALGPKDLLYARGSGEVSLSTSDPRFVTDKNNSPYVRLRGAMDIGVMEKPILKGEFSISNKYLSLGGYLDTTPVFGRVLAAKGKGLGYLKGKDFDITIQADVKVFDFQVSKAYVSLNNTGIRLRGEVLDTLFVDLKAVKMVQDTWSGVNFTGSVTLKNPIRSQTPALAVIAQAKWSVYALTDKARNMQKRGMWINGKLLGLDVTFKGEDDPEKGLVLAASMKKVAVPQDGKIIRIFKSSLSPEDFEKGPEFLLETKTGVIEASAGISLFDSAKAEATIRFEKAKEFFIHASANIFKLVDVDAQIKAPSGNSFAASIMAAQAKLSFRPTVLNKIIELFASVIRIVRDTVIKALAGIVKTIRATIESLNEQLNVVDRKISGAYSKVTGAAEKAYRYAQGKVASARRSLRNLQARGYAWYDPRRSLIKAAQVAVWAAEKGLSAAKYAFDVAKSGANKIGRGLRALKFRVQRKLTSWTKALKEGEARLDSWVSKTTQKTIPRTAFSSVRYYARQEGSSKLLPEKSCEDLRNGADVPGYVNPAVPGHEDMTRSHFRRMQCRRENLIFDRDYSARIFQNPAENRAHGTGVVTPSVKVSFDTRRQFQGIKLFTVVSVCTVSRDGNSACTHSHAFLNNKIKVVIYNGHEVATSFTMTNDDKVSTHDLTRAVEGTSISLTSETGTNLAIAELEVITRPSTPFSLAIDHFNVQGSLRGVLDSSTSVDLMVVFYGPIQDNGAPKEYPFDLSTRNFGVKKSFSDLKALPKTTSSIVGLKNALSNNPSFSFLGGLTGAIFDQILGVNDNGFKKDIDSFLPDLLMSHSEDDNDDVAVLADEDDTLASKPPGNFNPLAAFGVQSSSPFVPTATMHRAMAGDKVLEIAQKVARDFNQKVRNANFKLSHKVGRELTPEAISVAREALHRADNDIVQNVLDALDEDYCDNEDLKLPPGVHGPPAPPPPGCKDLDLNVVKNVKSWSFIPVPGPRDD